MKEIEEEKRIKWKQELVKERIVVSNVNVSESTTSLPSLNLHYSNESILKNSGNSMIHIGNDRNESIIIANALQNVCWFLLFKSSYFYLLLFVGHSPTVCSSSI